MGDPVFVIVGGGRCADSAAAALRSGGFEGRILLIADEDHPPYERPPLSKDYLSGKMECRELSLRPDGWYLDHDVDLRLGTRVEHIDEHGRTVELSHGERIRYDKVLVATGGRPRLCAGVSPESDRVLYLRTLDHADRLATQLAHTERLVVLGGGFVGCEVAASARELGVEVTVLEMAAVPLQRVLGEKFGGVLAEIHRDSGVDFRTAEQVRSVAETSNGLLVTTDLGRIECGMLLVAVGLEPNVETVAGTGVCCDNGIVVDHYCRTAVPDIFAAGDVARHYQPLYGRHVRVEHHDNALKQGAVAARNMLGENVAYTEPHWFWSDQYQHRLQLVGMPDPSCDIVVRGSIQDRSFSAFFLTGGRVSAVLALDRGKDVIAGRRLISSEVRVAAARLRDESTRLGGLVPDQQR